LVQCNESIHIRKQIRQRVVWLHIRRTNTPNMILSFKLSLSGYFLAINLGTLLADIAAEGTLFFPRDVLHTQSGGSVQPLLFSPSPVFLYLPLFLSHPLSLSLFSISLSFVPVFFLPFFPLCFFQSSEMLLRLGDFIFYSFKVDSSPAFFEIKALSFFVLFVQI
jgi:hypothetical protein